VASRRLAPFTIAAVLCAAGSLSAHAIGYWLEPARGAGLAHAWLALVPGLAFGGSLALIASLAVETRDIVRLRPAGRVPSWVFVVLPAAAFLVQEHLERAVVTAEVPLDTLAQPAVLAGLALQLPFGVAALVLARLLERASVAIAKRLARRTRPHVARRVPRIVQPDRRPRRALLRAPSGRGPPVLAVP
jgi:hypothetical protein